MGSEQVASMASSKDNNSNNEAQESLLYSARHGELSVVKAMLEAKDEGKLTLDINCKGKNKTNLGWTPLHLATYFGHKDVVEALLEAGANVDEVNDTGDSALHKASFIGNEELVILLLKYKADVNIMNGEGRTPCDMSKTRDVQRLLEAAGRAERHERELRLLTAAKDGRIDDIQELLSSPNPPNINCVDAQGNTCLHCAAYRGHTRLAVLLLQNGVDTTLRNNSGQLAIDMAKDTEMREVLSVRPVQRLQRTAARFEGPLLKRSRFLGWRPVWAVVQRGVLLYYGSRAEAARPGAAWRARKYLDAATLSAVSTDPAAILLRFSDGDTHRLAQWVTALNEHIAYSGHYLWAGASPDSAREATEDLEDEVVNHWKDTCVFPSQVFMTNNLNSNKKICMKQHTHTTLRLLSPKGSMQDALTAATNSLALLDTQLRECAAIVAALDKSVNVGTSLHHSAYMRFPTSCVATGSEAAVRVNVHLRRVGRAGQDADFRPLSREIERNRVLEEALAALARTHHALEMSVAEELTKSKRKKKSKSSSTLNDSKENFFDVFEESEDEDDTLVTAGLSSPLGALSPWGSSPDLTRRTPIGSLDGDKTPTNEEQEERYLRRLSGSSGSPVSLHTAVSAASSRGTLVSQGGHVYRNARPYRKNTHPSTHVTGVKGSVRHTLKKKLGELRDSLMFIGSQWSL
ncbi:hypothetical protein SFRURICE_014403 [Spodoptera frugiperda]|nr:hypothetical protein SFRURICE_014403 [Spodoptera frugiperda]